MSKQIDALKLALEHIEGNYTVSAKVAITAIKQALAKPEQLEGLKLIHKADIDLAKKRALEAQPEQEPNVDCNAHTEFLRRYAAAAEYFPPQPKEPEQEPVAVVTGVYGGRFTYAPIKASVILPVGMALYTRPQPLTLRNNVLEEVAKEFDRMTSLSDTAASFAAYVRGMKG